MDLEVKLTHPHKVRAIAEAKIKTDSIDARTLAHLLRADLIPESYVPPGEIRELRDKVRLRAKLGKSERTETRVIEDIADPQPVEVTEYEIDHYECDSCGEEVVAGHEDLPPEEGSTIMQWFRRPFTSIAEGPFTGGLETS